MLKWLANCTLAVVLTFVICLSASAQTNLQCKVIALHRECSGCSLRGAKAVLEVIENRQQVDKMSACQVVKKPFQFPWAAKQKSWKFSEQQLTRYFEAVTMLPVVGKGIFYFNTTDMSRYGKFAVQIENHKFYYRS